MMRNSGDGTLARRGDASEENFHGTSASGERQRPEAVVPWTTSGGRAGAFSRGARGDTPRKKETGAEGDGCGAPRMKPAPVLVIACGALGRELHAIRCANGWDHLRIRCLDPELHLRPAQIAPRLRAEIARARGQYRRIFIGYADCGSYGGIDRVLEDYPDVERLPGLHCYEFFAGAEHFERLADDEPGTFYLTDFLVRFFDRLVVETLQLDGHPELFDAFFGNYRRLVYLSQTRDPELLAGARAAAARLGLEFAHVHTGYGALESGVARIAEG